MISFLFLVFISGLLLGSFANVCIYRIPRGESIVYPASHCPACNAGIKWYQNIPLISFILLRGKCSSCKASISIQYPLVEFIAGSAFLLIGIRFGLQPLFFSYLLFTLILIIISGIDYFHRVIPDILSYALLGIGLAASVFNPLLGTGWKDRIFSSAAGAAAGALLILFIMVIGKIIFKKEAMGSGDLKLLAAIGAFEGPQKTFTTLVLAAVFGSIVGLALIFNKKIDRKDYMPFGPFLALGAFMNIVLPLSFLNIIFNPF